MPNIEPYDIVIIGAGPAGSSAALAAARKGLRVLLVERKKAVGIPVRCAEYIPKALLGELPFSDRSFVVQLVEGMRTILPDGTVRETRAPGLMIRRDWFDHLLSEAAVQEGAQLLLETRFLGVEDGEVVLKRTNKSFMKIKARIIIGADGPWSRVGKYMGSQVRRLVPAVQVKVALAYPMDHTEVYFDPGIYGGYAWLFPKGEEANAGLAVVGGTERSIPLRSALEWFLGMLKENGRIKGQAYGLTAGWLPVKPVAASVKGNMMLAGDAAGQTHPITGAGVPQAVLCGAMAGAWAARAVAEDDLGLTKGYEEQWREDYGDTLNWAFRRRRMMETNWDRLEDIIPKCWVAFREYYERS